VSVSVGGGVEEQTFNASFTDPYFLGNRMAFSANAYRTTAGSSSARPYESVNTGGALGLSLPVTDELKFNVNYKISQLDASQAPDCATSPAGCFFTNGSRLTSSVGWGLTYSTIDSTLDPHEGVFVRFGQDFAGVGGDARFVRTTAEARYYRPLLEDSDLVGMVKVAGGNITGLGQPVNTLDNFFKGGETVRGFAPLGYGPRETSTNTALGGKNFVAATAEVQFPLPFLPPDFGLRGAFFADAGLLWGADIPSTCTGCVVVDDTAIRTSVGGSIIWASPFGPIRADFAQAINKQNYDQTQVFRIGTGAAF
jgi:outer membrane protein insertion porin family